MKRKNIWLNIITIVLVLVILFCAAETVMSRNKADAGEGKQYYALMEKVYLSDMKQFLEKRGYCNSGITIRWVSDMDGIRTYTVMIYHRKIDALGIREKEELMEELSKIEFSGQDCVFCYQFLSA